MYLEMIFGKNKEQTTRQLQFKFDPLLAESAEICLFHERWIKTFYTQPFGQLCIKYVLVFYKIDLVQFCNNYLGGPSQKNLLLSTRKMENGFFVQRKWKTSLGNIVCHSNMHPCAQYEIIWTNYAMDVAIRLIIWLENHWSPHVIARFWEHFFKIIAVLQVCYFS